jgi:hypothetical protein
MDDKSLGDLRTMALKSLESQERAFKARMQGRIDHYNSVLEMTRSQLQAGANRQDLLKTLEIDALMSW